MLGANLVPRGCDPFSQHQGSFVVRRNSERQRRLWRRGGWRVARRKKPCGRPSLSEPRFSRAGCKPAYMIKTHFYLSKLINLRSLCKDFGGKMYQFLIFPGPGGVDWLQLNVWWAYFHQNVDWLQVSAPLLSVAQRVFTPSLKTSNLSRIQRHSGARQGARCPPTSIRRIAKD